MRKSYLTALILVVIVIAAIIAVPLWNGPKAAAPLSDNLPIATTTIPLVKNQIHVTFPLPNSVVSSPIKVTGQARGGWFFEAVFPVVLADAGGKVIVQTNASSEGDWMTDNLVPFQASVVFPLQASGSRGFVIFKKDNPSGLPQNEAMLKIPVVFK